MGRRVQQLASAGNNSDSLQIDIHAVSCAPNRPLCRSLAIDQYPYFRIFLPGDSQGFDVPHAQVNPFSILQKMGIEVNEIADDDIDNFHGRKSVSDTLLEWGRLVVKSFYFASTQKGKFDIARSRENLRDDIHLSFDFAMRQGVFLSDDPLSPARAEVLFAWLRLLRKTLPVAWTSLHSAVRNLIDNFDYVKRSESYMITILDEYSPPSQVWSLSCSRGEIDAGFTCGLWELFHAVTVGVVDYNRAAAFHRNRIATEDVARSIRYFVEAFFPCEICRQNFIAMFDSCAFRRCEVLHLHISNNEIDWIQLPLWLLDTHNGVNVRLMKEKAKQENRLSRITMEDERAVSWPRLKDCPRCWLPDGIKNSEMTYKYLKLEYGHRDALSTEYKQELLPNDIPSEFEVGGAPASMYHGYFMESFSYYYNHFMEEFSCYKFLFERVYRFVLSMTTAMSEQPASTTANLDLRRSDIYLFFVTSMRREVFPAGADHELPDSKKAVMQDWLKLLQKTIPASWYEFHSLIQELLDNWTYVAKSKDYLLAVLDESSPIIQEWSPNSCIIKGQSEFGYNCVVFEMFHVVTLGVVHYNKFNATSDKTRLATLDVSHILRRYVDNFFRSSQHQVEILEAMEESCSDNRCRKLLEVPGTEINWVCLPMWISQIRDLLSRDPSYKRISRGPDSLAIAKGVNRWPSPIECSKCWIDSNVWDDDSVYKYILREYGQDSILSIEIKEKSHVGSKQEYESPLISLLYWISSFFRCKGSSDVTGFPDRRKTLSVVNDEF